MPTQHAPTSSEKLRADHWKWSWSQGKGKRENKESPPQLSPLILKRKNLNDHHYSYKSSQGKNNQYNCNFV